MPPMVAREAVEMSTGNHRPCGLSRRLSSSSTMPGSTTQRRPATSSSTTWSRYFEQSTISDELMVWPHCEVPPPRGVHADALLARERDRALGFLDRARRDHAERHDLVVRGVGGVAAAGEAVELHVAQQLRLEPPFEPGQDRFSHRISDIPRDNPAPAKRLD